LAIPLPFSGKLFPGVEDSLKKLKGNFDVYILRDAPEDLDKGDRIWRISRCRERIRQYFLSHPEYDSLLFIDADIVFPENTLELLSSFDGDVIIHTYQGEENIGKKRKMPKVNFPTIKIKNGKIIVYSGLGCVLIKRKVLEVCDFVLNVESWESLWGEDVTFYRQVHDYGFKVTILEDNLNLIHLSKTLERESFWKQLKDNPSEFKKWGKSQR